MPQLYIDADNFNFISDPAFKSTTGSYTFKRGDKAPLYLNFVSGNTVLSAVPGRTIKFGVKKLGEYDSTFVVSTSAYTINTSPFTGLSSYLLQPSFNTVELNQLLSAFDNDPGNDQASVTLMGEITVSDDGVNFDSTNTVNIVVNNDVIRGDESTPLINPSPVQWLCTNLASLSCPIAMATGASISTTTGSIYSQSGTIFTTSGNFSTTSGAVYGGGNIYSTTGNIYTGNGNIYTSNGDMTAGGDIHASGYGSTIYVSYGDIYVTYGNIYSTNGSLGAKTSTPQFALDVNDPTIAVRGNRTLSAANVNGTAGEVCFDANYIYRCVATNTWKRSALTTWT